MDTTHQLSKVFHWRDDRTEAEGWLVIDSLVGGVSGGGLFMHQRATLSEVADLAASMSLKHTLQRPRFGGGKGGIRFDPASAEAEGVLRRFMIAHREIIAREWSTGADLYTSREVIERIAREDLSLPSAFVAMADMLAQHAGIPSQALAMTERLARPWNEYSRIDDAATGHSVAESIRLTVPGTPRVAIQGFGSVGSNAAYSLASRGIGVVVGICERDGYLISRAGLDVAEILHRRAQRGGWHAFGELVRESKHEGWNWVQRCEGQSDEEFLAEFVSAAGADVLAPCASRYVLTDSIMHEFARGSGKAVICGANNAFEANVARSLWSQRGMTIVPEWVSSSGGATLFTELLKTDHFDRKRMEEIFETITMRIKEYLAAHNVHAGYEECRSAERIDSAAGQC